MRLLMAKLLGGSVLIWGMVGEVTCNHLSAGTGTRLLILGRILEPSKCTSGAGIPRTTVLPTRTASWRHTEKE